jgi:hypothetical protein
LKIIRLSADGATVETVFKRTGDAGESAFQRVGRAAAAANSNLIIGSSMDRHVASGRADKTMQGRYRLERRLY